MNDIRKLIDLIESYSQDNASLFRYFKNDEFDPYPAWYYVCQWIIDNDYIDDLARLTGIEDLNEDNLEDEDPSIFYKMPAKIQKECAKDSINAMMENEPHEVDSIHHMSLASNNLLPRSTWLIHFTDAPFDIANNGFVYGADRMDKLGLTTHFTQDSKKIGGYNFSFVADSKYAIYAARNNKYGKHAVLFQSAATLVHHYADEENQAVFWGKDVDPRYIIVLYRNYENDWEVRTKDDSVLISGEFEKVVEWVINHHQQYRKVLFKR